MESGQEVADSEADGIKTDLSDKENPVEDLIIAFSDFNRLGNEQLSFKKGEEIKILQKTTDTWWWAELDGCCGYVPVNHVIPDRRLMWQDEEYFGSYGNLKLHHEMLSDRPRNLAYLNAIVKNSDFLSGKVILDIGCGTGILSMMCARHADPKKVYAVEASDIAKHTREVIKQNRLSDVIEVLQGNAEDIVIGEKVDIIISEWMGTMLLFEMMIESVIKMRDKFLEDDGIIWPSTASLILVPCSAHAQYNSKVEFWDTQFGFDFSSLKSVAKEDLLCKPVHDYILPIEDCMSREAKLFQLCMSTVTVQYLEQIICDFDFSISKAGTMHGFCAWFEVGFDPPNANGKEVLLNTGPCHELTHWKQNLFLLDEPVSVKEGDRVVGSVILSRNPVYRRHLTAEYQFTVLSGCSVVGEIQKMFFIWR